MKYLQKLGTLDHSSPYWVEDHYLSYDYVASYGDYDKQADSTNNGVLILDEPFSSAATLFYTSTNDSEWDRPITYYNSLLEINADPDGFSYKNISIKIPIPRKNGEISPYSFVYTQPGTDRSFKITINETCSVYTLHIIDGITFPNTPLDISLHVSFTGNSNDIKYSNWVIVSFYESSSIVYARITPENGDDPIFSVHVDGISLEEFDSTPIFIPTRWSTNTYEDGQGYITIMWYYYPGAYLSNLTPDETPKQIQLNSENV